MNNEKKPVSQKASQQIKQNSNPHPIYRFLSHYSFVFLFLAAFVFLLYYSILRAPFVFDDIRNICANKSIHIESLQELFRFLFNTPIAPRRIGFFTFSLNYYFGGLDPFGYHLTNIFIHIINACLIFWLIRRTLTMPRIRGVKSVEIPEGVPGPTINYTMACRIAFFTSLIWVVHPLQIQAVTYIVQRFSSLAALLFLSSFAFYISGRLRTGGTKYGFYGLSILSGLLAMGIKENAVVLPIMIFFFDLLFFYDSPWEALKKKWPFIIILLIFLVIISWSYLGPSFLTRLQRDYSFYGFTMWERLLTEFRVILYYVSLLLWPSPSRLSLDYDFPVSSSLFDPISTFISAVAMLAIITLSITRANKHPLLSFSILWFFGNLVIESTIIPLDLVFEHRLYLPSIGPIGAAVTFICKKLWFRNRLTLYIILLLIAGIFSYWTFSRNKVWTTPVRLWSDNVLKSPLKGRVHGNLGKALRDEGRYKEAASAFEKALELGFNDPYDYFATCGNLGAIYINLKRYDHAKKHLEKAAELGKVLKLNPGDKDLLFTYNNLARVYIDHLKQYGKAEEILNAILRRDPDYTDAHLNLGVIALNEGRFDQKKLLEAIQAFNKVLKLNPRHQMAHYNLAAAFINLRNFSKALEVIDKGLSYWPDFHRLYLLKGLVHKLMKNPTAAHEALEKAHALNPEDLEVLHKKQVK